MRSRSGWQLAFGTLSFAICFAAWGLISAFAPRFREVFHLSATDTAFLVAVPVILGSLARIPMGMLADRFGGRIVFAALMISVALPVALVPRMHTYPALLAVAFCLGMAGSSFSIGVGFCSRWFPPQRQGGALGVYGMGNIGQSAAVFLGPVIAAAYGWDAVYYGVAAMLVIWGAVFAVSARNAPVTVRPKTLGEMLGVLAHERLSWVLSAFYFLTFGGFVAFSIYLPTLLRDQFGLTPKDAGFRAAGFVVLATFMRPVGGWLSDRIGGARVLSGVFLGVIPFALLLSWPVMIPFTVGALGCAALLGVGNGAVFQLVPKYFAKETGTVTGLVGAMGGLGGFFPPLLLGLFRDRMGAVWPGFVLLALLSAVLWVINARVFLATENPVVGGGVRAGAWATLVTGLLVASIVVGSRNLQNFDPALVIYTFATIFATWGVVYHYAVWLQKPPTRVYWKRGWELLRKMGPGAVLILAKSTATHLVGQNFIRRRSMLRWCMHQMLFWGCLLAAAITFPLVWGWISFASSPHDQMTYITYLFDFPVASFPIRTFFSWLMFHGLDVAAVLVLGGIALSLWRRMLDPQARAVQQFGMDFLPLMLLFAISVTGLALTVSTTFLRGQAYEFLAILHAATVIAALLYLPFGKFFHIFQRPAQLGVKLYVAEGDSDPGTYCVRCKQRFASKMHVDDLRKVLPELGFDYRLDAEGKTWQDLCPACKRCSLASAQLRLKEEARG